MPSEVILYRYDTSPFSVKIDNILLLKNIPHQAVIVSWMLPRPEITELLGIGYRRIPILAIGNDVYCDTSLIASALERRFPPSQGYGTIFPRGKHGNGADTGLIKAFSKFYADTTLFNLGPSLLPWNKFPPEFVKDRSALRGAPIDVETLLASRGTIQSVVASHVSLIEEQLHDSREWLFDTELPSLADISVHFVCAWILNFPGSSDIVHDTTYPHTLAWIKRMTRFLEQRKATQEAPQRLTGDAAASFIVSSQFEPYSVVGFDTLEATRLTLKAGEMIQVYPDDTGRNYPTVGKLVGINKEEFVLEVQAKQGLLRCHFPRLSFSAKTASDGQSRL
ncbi:hypothetical protein BD779DRAFT_382010 [Infundibulicybe gibba]|nr:hypothetical protein BD779DRAFT_382010 [Infundibulicybe gibba]